MVAQRCSACGAEQVYARKQHVSIIGAIGIDGTIARATVRGGVGSKEFRRFVERQLVPHLRPGHIVLLDNLNAHKNKRVRQLTEGVGATLVFLPPYSPDLNPIEAAWSKLKHLVRKSTARTLTKGHLTASSAEGWFSYCGYDV